MGNYTILYMFENPRRGRQAKNVTANVPKILDLKQRLPNRYFSENCRWVPLLNMKGTQKKKRISFGIHNYLGKISYELRSLGLEICQSSCVP